MPAPSVERRRHERVEPAEEVRLDVPVVVHAEVLDLSRSGALISTSAGLQVGQRAELQVLLERQPFTARFEVRRVELGTETPGGRRYRVAAAFQSLDEKSRQALKRFLKE